MTTSSEPASVAAYLSALKRELQGLPNAVIRDGLADTEEHLRSELAQRAGESEATVIADVMTTFGTPSEIAEEYRSREQVLSQPSPRIPAKVEKKSTGFFGIIADPHAYGALIYMLLSLATGIFYFTWVVTGASLTLGLSILIIGIPVALLFIASVRILSLVEGRIVEGLLGVRMPRRLPAQSVAGETVWAKIKNALTDIRTWSSMVYLGLMLPLGIAYFTAVVTLLATSLGLTFGSLYAAVFENDGHIMHVSDINEIDPQWRDFVVNLHDYANGPLGIITCMAVGILLLFVTLHLAKGVGRLHGLLAETLLVRV